MTVLLIDDERSFIDNRDAVVVRTPAEALAYIQQNPNVTELWLDYILGFEDIVSDVLFPLVRKQLTDGVPVITAEKVFYHSSSNSGYSLVASLCAKLGLPTPEIVHHRDVFVTR